MRKKKPCFHLSLPGVERNPADPSPEAASLGWLKASLFLALSGIALSACKGYQTAQNERALEAQGEDLLQLNDPNAAISSFQRLSETTENPELKAKAKLGIARAYIKLGNYRKALDTLYSARSLFDFGPLRESADRLFADASFSNRDYGIARDYLEKVLGRSHGQDRDIVLAKLYVCAKMGLDTKSAQRYLSEISKPLSSEIRETIRAHLEVPESFRETSPPSLVRPGPPRFPIPEIPSTPMKVIPRGYWGARPVFYRRIDPMGKIYRLTIHHTGGSTFWGNSASEAADEIRKIQRVHQYENRWADIGYHFIVDRVGRVWEGRPLIYQGAHAHGDANRGNVGIVILGNYLHQDINVAQVRALRNLVGWLSERFEIPASRIYTHCEIRHGTTDCPGPTITRMVSDIRRSMASSRLAN